MDSNNRYTIYPSTSNSVSVFQPFWTKTNRFKFGPMGNKRKNFRDREKWLKELKEPVKFSPPTGKLFYMGILKNE